MNWNEEMCVDVWNQIWFFLRAHTSNLSQAMDMWKSTNNTLGMNHQIASASDNFPGKT